MKTIYDQKKKTSRIDVTSASGGTMARLYRFLILISFSMALSACGAFNNIYWVKGAGKGKVITVDAKQRHMIMMPDGANPAQWRVCAEAAPDVFSANSTALTAALRNKKGQQEGQGSLAIAEAAAAIGRTQTVNVIRESMYRTCERYLSGALTKSSFIVQAARDQRSMVAILAIEQLTGANRTTSATLASPSAEASLSGPALDASVTQELLVSQNKRINAAQAAKDEAATDFKTINELHHCENQQTYPHADKKVEEQINPKPSEWQDCKTTQAKLETAEKNLQREHDRSAETAKLGGFEQRRASANAGGGTSSDPENPSAPDYAGLATVANVVKEIVKSPNIDEPLMFCLAYLTDPPKSNFESNPIIKNCLGILNVRALTEEKRLRKNDTAKAELESYLAAYTKMYDQFEGLIVDKILAIDDKKAENFLREFEIQAGRQPFSRCDNRAACIARVRALKIYVAWDDGTDLVAALERAIISFDTKDRNGEFDPPGPVVRPQPAVIPAAPAPAENPTPGTNTPPVTDSEIPQPTASQATGV